MPSRLLLPALLFLPAAALAQWPAWPTGGALKLPRDAAGKIDLAGPAPKTADGHPDLSGVWDRGMPAQQGQRPFQDLPSLFPGGLPMQPWAAKLRAERKEQNSKDHPDAHCLPLHPVQLHSHPQPRKIIQTARELLIMYEANDGLRQIFTDGRTLPKDPDPWWYGYSIGKWDGDTLVVDSIGFKDLGWIDEEGTPLTESGRVTERFRRLTLGTLEIEVTVEDPKAYTKPFTFKLTQRLLPDTELIEFVCAENNRSLPHLVGK